MNSQIKKSQLTVVDMAITTVFLGKPGSWTWRNTETKVSLNSLNNQCHHRYIEQEDLCYTFSILILTKTTLNHGMWMYQQFFNCQHSKFLIKIIKLFEDKYQMHDLFYNCDSCIGDHCLRRYGIFFNVVSNIT